MLSQNKKQINVLMILRNFVKTPNGTQLQAITLAEALVKAGVNVEFLVGDFGGVKDKSRPEASPGIPAHVLPSIKIRGIGTMFYIISLAFFLILNRKKYDIYHVFFAKYSAFIAGALKFIHGNPVVCKPAGGGVNGDIAALQNRVRFKKMVFKGIANADALIAVSRAIKDEFINANFSESRIVFIPNGVDMNRFADDLLKKKSAQSVSAIYTVPRSAKDSKLRLLFVGRLSPHKGLSYLFDALCSLKGKMAFHLQLIGDGELRDELISKAKQAEISDSVEFLGSRTDIAQYYLGCDVFILPSVSEGLSNSLLEAMASGRAVIASNVSGTEDVIQNGISGIIVPPQDSAALAEAIMKIASAPELRKTLGDSAKKSVMKNYSIESVVEKYLALYERLLRR